jgi:hypothetical protein
MLELEGKPSQKAEKTKRKQRCVREINLSLRRERNTYNYPILHFIEMYTSYLAACKPWITQQESVMKDKGD